MVSYREVRASAQLQPIIESCWLLEHDGETADVQRVVPDGHPELILHLGQPFEALEDGEWRGQQRCFLAGQITGPLLLRPGGPARVLGIRLQPHGAARLLGAPMHELADRFTPIDDLSPALFRDLDRAMELATAGSDPLAVIEASLARARTNSSPGDPVMAYAAGRMALDGGATDLAALARELGLSIRQLERRFNACVGLPPKLFCRLQRFTRVFQAIGNQPCNWVDTAVECGYYDQSHLIRDFKSFTGETPSALLAKDADLARHFLQRFGVSHSYNTIASQAG